MKMKQQSVKNNFIYNTFYQLLAIVLPLITTPYISRILGAEEIGKYSYSYSIAYYFVIFIMLGLNNYGNRTIASVREDKEKLSKTFWGIYAMQLFTAIIAIIIYIIFALLFSNNIMTWILLLYILSAAIDINWFFFGLEEFKLTVIRNSIVKIATTISIFIFVKNPNDIYLYALIMVLGLFVSPCMIWPFVKKYISFVKISIQDVKVHIRPNLVLFIPVIAVSLYKMMDKIMLGSMSDMKHVGYYENTEKIVQVPMALINSLGTVMLPKMSNLVAKNDNKNIKKYFETSIIFAMFLSSSICFGIMGVSKEFVPWFYGKGYEQCIDLFKILMPSCVFLAFANVVRTQYLIPYKEDKIYIKSVILGAIVNLIANSLLIPKFASTGAAIGTLLAEATVCICQIWKIRNKVENIKKYILEIIPFIIFGILMYIILIITPSIANKYFIDLVIKIFLGSIIYMILAVIYFIIMKRKKII